MKKNYFKNYSLRQHRKVYGSTLGFIEFLENYVDLNNKNLIDLACGGGANTIYLAKKYPQSFFLGIDYDRNLIKFGNKYKKNLKNIKFVIDNWKNVNLYKKFISGNKVKNIQPQKKMSGGGIICFQSLTCLDMQLNEILKNFKKKNFPFIAFNSLFFEGKCNYRIFAEDFSQASEFKKGWYNIYSIHTMKNILIKKGYKNFKFKKFDIQYDLPKPKHSGMQSYTVKNYNGKRIVFSGALHIPYGFFLAY